MDYPLEFVTWLEDHDDLCNEQFHSSAIPEYLKGNIEWYPVILFHMGCELYDGDFDEEFDRRLNSLYKMKLSITKSIFRFSSSETLIKSG